MKKYTKILFIGIIAVLIYLMCSPNTTDISGHISTVTTKVEAQSNNVPKMRSLGIYKITAYCPCYRCSEGYGTQTATGKRATEGRTIAVDPKVIPYGTKLYIKGVGDRIAEDCGGAIKGKKLDLYFDTHRETLQWGVQELEVFIYE